MKDKIIIPIFHINAQLIYDFNSEIYYKYGQELIVDNIDNVEIYANERNVIMQRIVKLYIYNPYDLINSYRIQMWIQDIKNIKKYPRISNEYCNK